MQPPRLGPRYTMFVPEPDEDGLNVASIRPMQIRVPLGTSTGWNVRALGHRPPNLCGLTGSFLPFATSKAEPLATGDPRKSLEERYKDHAGFVKAVKKAAKELVHDRFADGMSFGDVGAYQRLDGTAYMEVDPYDPLNAVIVNLDRARCWLTTRSA